MRFKTEEAYRTYMFRRRMHTFFHGFLFVVGMVWAVTLGLVAGCQEASRPNPVTTTAELPGTIVCHEPWGEPGSRFNHSAEVVYRDAIGPWEHNMHNAHGPSARTSRGVVTRNGMHIRFTDENGNWMYLVNYPCRITLPPQD